MPIPAIRCSPPDCDCLFGLKFPWSLKFGVWSLCYAPLMAYGKVNRQINHDVTLRCAANGVKPRTARVVDHIVVTGWADARRHVIQPQRFAQFPSHDMISARSVPADAQGPHKFMVLSVERQPAAKN